MDLSPYCESESMILLDMSENCAGWIQKEIRGSGFLRSDLGIRFEDIRLCISAAKSPSLTLDSDAAVAGASSTVGSPGSRPRTFGNHGDDPTEIKIFQYLFS